MAIEADEAVFERLEANRPATMKLNAPVCSSAAPVHFLQAKEGDGEPPADARSSLTPDAYSAHHRAACFISPVPTAVPSPVSLLGPGPQVGLLQSLHMTLMR